jgi:HlyD family secretion protein
MMKTEFPTNGELPIPREREHRRGVMIQDPHVNRSEHVDAKDSSGKEKKQSLFRRPGVIIAAAALAVVGIGYGAFAMFHSFTAKATVTLYGNVDIREVTLGFRVPGKLANLRYDEGDKVKAGDVIASLDAEPYNNQVANVQAQVAQARSLVREREATAANAERLFKRANELFATKVVSVQDRDNAAAGHEEAQARLKSSRDDLAQADAALATANLQLKDTVLTAPSNGVILTRAQEAGAILQAGSPVFTLSLVNPVWVRAYVHEPDLGRIHPGMKVEIRTDSRRDKPYIGEIGFISERAEFTPKTVETTELRTALVYRLRIVVSDPDEGLRQGMPVTATLVGNDLKKPRNLPDHE